MTTALLVPARAWAHAHLKRSDPAAGAQLGTPPQFIRLWFTEQPDLSMTFASLKDSAGTMFRLSPAERETSGQLGIALRLLEDLPPGRYTLSWRTAGSDGHPSTGKFTFIVLKAPQVSSVTPVRPEPRADSAGDLLSGGAGAVAGEENALVPNGVDAAGSIGNSIARAFLFLGLLAVIGATSFKLLVLPRAQAVPTELKKKMSQRAAMLGILSAVLVIIVSLVRLYLESQMMSAMPEMPGMKGMSTREMVMNTGWGVAFRLQLATAIAALIGFVLVLRRVPGGWLVAGASALLLAVTPALGGHAAASPSFTAPMIAADWLHVLAAAGWLGSLLSLMLVGVRLALTLDPPDRWACVASLVNAFSPLALVCAGVVVVSGVFASWVHLEDIPALWQTTYGKVLLVKLFLVAMTLGIGGYNFKRVQPELSNHIGAERLRRSAAAELGTAFLILLVTGLLTGVSP